MSLVLLEAPAGYAKTTCLAFWDAADEREFCWVSCRERHNDPAVLVSAIVEALEPVELLDPEVLLALSSPTPDLDTVLGRLEAALRRTAVPFVLVIDDAHMLTAAGTGEVLEAVFRSLPESSQMAIGSRNRPPLPIGRIRANRELVELGAAELAMTRRESEKLLVVLGLDLDSRQIDGIFDRTEGWPAALYLAGLAMLESGDGTDGDAEAFAGDDRIVVEYLRDEFFSGLSDETARFLARTSLLDELSGPICDAVLERSDSGRILGELARTNAMVVPLDRTETLFRYHHLFSDMLRSELRRREPEAENGIHARAGRWYEANGQPVRAVDHAIASGDLELTGEVLWEIFPDLIGRGQVPTLDRWLEEIGEDRIRTSIPLMQILAHREIASGRGGRAAHWADVAGAAAGPDSPYRHHLRVLNATLGRYGISQMEDDAVKASEGLDPASMWQSSCKLFQGVAVQLRGDAEAAEPILRDAASSGAVHSPVIQILALTQLTLLSVDEGHWEAASRTAGHAREQIERCGLTTLGSMAIAFAASALLKTRERKVEAASADLARCNGLLEQNAEMPGWYEAELRLILCRVNLRLGDPESAAKRLQEASLIIDRIPDSPVLERWLGEMEESLEQVRGTLAGDGFTLTKAELRILQHLPSHYSVREIAEQLNLSQNTVKTQVGSLYRKVGANSRAEAVMMARQAGLLDRAGV